MANADYGKELSKYTWMFTVGCAFMFGCACLMLSVKNEPRYIPIAQWFFMGGTAMLLIYALTVYLAFRHLRNRNP